MLAPGLTIRLGQGTAGASENLPCPLNGGATNRFVFSAHASVRTAVHMSAFSVLCALPQVDVRPEGGGVPAEGRGGRCSTYRSRWSSVGAGTATCRLLRRDRHSLRSLADERRDRQIPPEQGGHSRFIDEQEWQGTRDPVPWARHFVERAGAPHPAVRACAARPDADAEPPAGLLVHNRGHDQPRGDQRR